MTFKQWLEVQSDYVRFCLSPETQYNLFAFKMEQLSQ